MTKQKKFERREIWKAAVAFAVAMAFIMPGAVAFVNDEETSTFEVERTDHGIELIGMDITRAKTKELITSSDEPLPMDPVLTGYHPTVANDLLGNVVLGFEDDSPNVWFTASLDGGQTWINNAAGWNIPEPPELPDVDSCGDGRFIGGMVPHPDASDGSELYKVVISDPGLIPDGYNCPYWPFETTGDGYTNFDSIAVAGYTAEAPEENTWAYGGHAITGDHGGDSGDDTIFFSYQFDNTGYAWIYRWTGINGAEDCTHDIDPGNLYSYAAWNFDNEGVLDVYVSIIDFGTWVPVPPSYQQHPDVDDLVIETSGNDTYIDISALNDNVIVVSERDGDAVAYYSTNGMSSVNEASIATGASNPRIVHTDDLTAMCVFVKSGRDGTVYYSETEDGGATWSVPEELTSDPVAEDFQRADVCGFGAAYESDDIIYFEPIGGGPPPMPILEITSIVGGLGVIATIKNTGNAAATNVTWSISVTGGLLGFINKTVEDTIASLAVDEESDPLKTGIFFGLGEITVEVTVTCDEGVSDEEIATGTQIIIFTRIS